MADMTNRSSKPTLKPNPEQEKKRRRALEGLKKIREAKFRDIEGKRDVSINHDNYLDKIYGSWNNDESLHQPCK